MKVLAVEDDAISLKLVTTLLKKDGAEVIAVNSAKGALDYLEQGEFVDVIVSDVMMPEMDGFQLLHYLKNDKRLSTIPVILCTALHDKASIVKGIQAGIADYIVKPIKESVLISKVKKAAESGPKPVLIVDDEPLFLSTLFTTLNREGYRVMTAKSGKEALEMLDSNHVGLVLSDIKMPEMDGLELLILVKDKFPDMPVLLMTGRGEYTRGVAIGAGADDLISKPFHNTEIIAKVRVHIKSKKKKGSGS